MSPESEGLSRPGTAGLFIPQPCGSSQTL